MRGDLPAVPVLSRARDVVADIADPGRHRRRRPGRARAVAPARTSSGIDSVVLEDAQPRIRRAARPRGRARAERPSTCSASSGLADRLHREGLVHHGIDLQFDGRGHRDRADRAHRPSHHHLRAAGAGQGPDRGPAGAGGAASIRGRGCAPDRGSTATGARRPLPPDGVAQRAACDVVAGCDGFHGVVPRAIPPAC